MQPNWEIVPSPLDQPRTDNKGRLRVEHMTDRQLLEECVRSMRTTQDMVTQFVEDMAKNPMMGMIGGMMGNGRKSKRD